jgi:hypothetical protein
MSDETCGSVIVASFIPVFMWENGVASETGWFCMRAPWLGRMDLDMK